MFQLKETLERLKGEEAVVMGALKSRRELPAGQRVGVVLPQTVGKPGKAG
jgi:hypothetical protein